MLAPTRRGHGLTARAHGGHSLADGAEDARRLLDAPGIEQAHVVGHFVQSLLPDEVRGAALDAMLPGDGVGGLGWEGERVVSTRAGQDRAVHDRSPLRVSYRGCRGTRE